MSNNVFGIETERKFLLKNIPDEAFESASMNIIQGYINDSERIRILLHNYVAINEPINITHIETAYHGIKIDIPGSVSRKEKEEIVNYEKAMQLLDESQKSNRVIRKIRYLVNIDNNLWEIDEFFGKLKGLVIAEIEGDEEVIFSKDFKAPFKNAIDVTGNKSFYNYNLSKATKIPKISI